MELAKRSILEVFATKKPPHKTGGGIKQNNYGENQQVRRQRYKKNQLQITLSGFHGEIDTIGDVVMVAGGKVGEFRKYEVDIVARLAEFHRLYFVGIGKNTRPFVSAGREANNINVAVAIVENVTAYAVTLYVVCATGDPMITTSRAIVTPANNVTKKSPPRPLLGSVTVKNSINLQSWKFTRSNGQSSKTRM